MIILNYHHTSRLKFCLPKISNNPPCHLLSSSISQHFHDSAKAQQNKTMNSCREVKFLSNSEVQSPTIVGDKAGIERTVCVVGATTERQIN